MKKPIIIFMILLILLPANLFSEPLKGYEPYQEGEFPLWTYKIRRAETIFFGSMIITFRFQPPAQRSTFSGNHPPQTSEVNDFTQRDRRGALPGRLGD